MTKSNTANKVAYGHVIRMLMEGAYTAKKIAEETGFHPTTVQSIMTTWHQLKIIFVADYAKDSMGRDKAPMYSLGKGKDVTPTPGISNAEKMRRYRSKKKAIKMNNLLVGRSNDVP